MIIEGRGLQCQTAPTPIVELDIYRKLNGGYHSVLSNLSRLVSGPILCLMNSRSSSGDASIRG